MKNVKRNVTIVTVLLFVCAAVYLNWSNNNKWGAAEAARVEAEDAAMLAAQEAYEASAGGTSDYFAEARLNRQVSRDDALKLLESAAASDEASQETIDSAMNAISAMANYSMRETQLENVLLAKNFADCVVYMSDGAITVAVPSSAEGLSASEVAIITEAVTGETDYTASQLHVIEIKG